MSDERNEFNFNLGQKLQEARLKSKILQQDMADIIGCSRIHISQLENGKIDISAYELKQYALKCNISISSVVMYNSGATITDAIMKNFNENQINLILEIFNECKSTSEQTEQKIKDVYINKSNKLEFKNMINNMKNKQ